MIERNAVRRVLASAGSNASKGMLAMALTLSLTPAAALAQTGGGEIEGAAGSDATNTETAAPQSSEDAETSSSSIENYTLEGNSSEAVSQGDSYDLNKIADGEYAGSAVIADNGSDDNDDEWTGYTVAVTVKVSDHKISSVAVSRDQPSESDSYVKKAVEGTKKATGVPQQIVDKQSTDVDAISGATYTSNAIKTAVDNALQAAYDDQNSQPVESEYTYGYAALTWAEYWAAEGVYNAGDVSSSDEVDSHNEYDKGGYDVVTRATLNHGIKRVSFQSAMTLQTVEGKTFTVASWAQDQKTFTTPDGETCTWTQNGNKGATIADAAGNTYTFKDFSIYGTKYVPVKVKTADLDAFKAQHTFYANDSEIQIGVNGEGNMKPYAATANVTDETNGLKEATKSGDAFTFGKAKTGAQSGLKGQELKTVDLNNLGPKVYETDELGQFGEMMRVDFKGAGYGELGANMQSVTWTYYGDDATRSEVVATYGTKFEADNWMHSKIGIQLGLTDSARCQFPEGTDGTGYWTITIHALGYADSTYDFKATADNIKKTVTPVTEETKAALQAAYDKAAALNEDDYTAETWEKFVIERDEAKALLSKDELGESEAAQQVKDLQAAMDALEGYTYGYAGLTWAEYWAAEGVQAGDSAASSDLLDSRDESDKGAFDAVTRATTNHGLHRGSYQCMATIQTNEGPEFQLATWAADGKSFTTTDGKTVTWNRGNMTCDGVDYTMKDYEVTGLKYVPVKVKTSDLDAFKASHRFVENGGTLAGGYGEGQLKAYSETAQVTSATNGLKTVTKDGDSFTFSKAAAGSDSGIAGQTLKTADLASMGATVKEATGTYGEFLRVDFTKDFGDLGANMQAVTWEYYGNDSTYSKLVATFGTKFAADNWMHKSMGIQLGLTDSLRCQLPEGTDGTGYWKLTVHALGYADASYSFQATAENIADHTLATEATKAKLQALVDQANEKLSTLDQALYTEKSWNDLVTERDETVEMLAKANLEEAAAAEQEGHLQAAIEGLTLAPVTEATKQALDTQVKNAEQLKADDYSTASWAEFSKTLAAAKAALADASLTEQAAQQQVAALKAATEALTPSPRVALDAAIAAAAEPAQADYTAATWKAFDAALSAAKAVAADASASDEDVQAATDALVAAQSALVKAATADDKQNLAVEIGRADVLSEADYTAESWAAYQQALAAAKAVSEQTDPSQADVQKATSDLVNARVALAKPAAEVTTDNVDGATAPVDNAAAPQATTGGNATGLATTGDAAPLAATGAAAVGAAALAAVARFMRRRTQK